MTKLFILISFLLLMLAGCSINSDLYDYLPEKTKKQFSQNGFIKINDSLKIMSLSKDNARIIRQASDKRKFIFVYDPICDSENFSMFHSLSYLAKEKTIDFEVVLLSYHPGAFVGIPKSMHTRNIYVIDRTFGSKKWNRELHFLNEVFPELGFRKKGLSSAMVFVLDEKGTVIFYDPFTDAFGKNKADVYKAIEINP